MCGVPVGKSRFVCSNGKEEGDHRKILLRFEFIAGSICLCSVQTGRFCMTCCTCESSSAQGMQQSLDSVSRLRFAKRASPAVPLSIVRLRLC